MSNQKKNYLGVCEIIYHKIVAERNRLDEVAELIKAAGNLATDIHGSVGTLAYADLMNHVSKIDKTLCYLEKFFEDYEEEEE